MQFNSWIFIGLFLPVVLAGYYLLNRYNGRKGSIIFLTIANLAFYAYGGISYLIYFLICIMVNYALSSVLVKNKSKAVLVAGLVLNIGALAVLKYFNFFIETVNMIVKTDYNMVHLFIPLGMSFFTFQFIALLYDAYKGKFEKIDFLHYMAFSTYFPKIIQGPITIYQDFENQLTKEDAGKFDWDNIAQGLYMVAQGFAKKVIIADSLARFVDPGFSEFYSGYNSTMLLLLSIAYTLQIYFDFSGYTDIARGISRMLGINLPYNFNSPYKALSVNSFWKRWHMSLTGFFTKYLYIPLGGNRKGELRTYINTMIIFIVSGFWHGSSYTFIFWGFLHGLVCVIEKRTDFVSKLNPVLQWIYTFSFVNFAWIFFRAGTFSQAFSIIKGIVRCDFGGINFEHIAKLIPEEVVMLINILGQPGITRLFITLIFVLLFFILLQLKNSDEKENTSMNYKRVLFTAVVIAYCMLHFGDKITFIYEMF